MSESEEICLKIFVFSWTIFFYWWRGGKSVFDFIYFSIKKIKFQTWLVFIIFFHVSDDFWCFMLMWVDLVGSSTQLISIITDRFGLIDQFFGRNNCKQFCKIFSLFTIYTINGRKFIAAHFGFIYLTKISPCTRF